MDSPAWGHLVIGETLTIVKLSPDGAEAARYSGEVVGLHAPEAWCVVEATWTHNAMSIDGLEFDNGDKLLEWFSPQCPFNAFALHDSSGELKGWYANVTYPSYLQDFDPRSANPLTLVWHDLYLDLIGLPDGSFVYRDMDELDEAKISASDPALYDMILAAGEALASRFSRSEIPFVRGGLPRQVRAGSESL